MGETVRSSPKDFLGIGAAQSTEIWKKARSSPIDAAALRKEIRVRKSHFFHLPGSRPEQEEMKTHVAMLGERRNGCISGRYQGNSENLQFNKLFFEPMDIDMVTRAKTISFRTKELAKGNRRSAAPRWSAHRRALPSVHLAFVIVGGIVENGSCWCGGNVGNQQRSLHAQKRNWYLFCYTHNRHTRHLAAHTAQAVSRPTDVTGQKGMLGTRIIHVFCVQWESLFAAMVRENSRGRRGRTFLA